MTTYARRLGLFSTTMAVVGGIIGGGIFRTPAAVAGRVGSPGLALAAWVVGGVVALIGALCYGELGHRRPRAGGGYVYLRETFGPLPAFLYGWTLLLVIATGAIAAVAVLFADYALPLLGLPEVWTLPVAVASVVVLSGINYLGVRPGALTQNLFTVLKLLALALLVGVGLADLLRALDDPRVRHAAPALGAGVVLALGTIAGLTGVADVLVLAVSAPPLLAALAVGLVTGVLQAVTQIQEPTVGVVPRLGAVFVALAVAAPWIGARVAQFARSCLDLVPRIAP